MRYFGLPLGMKLVFGGSFKKNLSVFGYDKKTANAIAKRASKRYKSIIADLPDFEKGDRFQMNIVSCAQFAAFYLSLPERQTLASVTAYYDKAMMTKTMKRFCKMMGKKKFSPKDVAGMRKTEAFRAADRNPFSWNMTFEPFASDAGYCAKFTHCGICVLLQKLGIPEVTPAMCAWDYAMAEAGGVCTFTRQYTLATGGPYCDCNYHKNIRVLK